MVVFEKYVIERRMEESLKENIPSYEAHQKRDMCVRLLEHIMPHVPFEKTIGEGETTYEMQMYVFTPEKWQKFTEELKKYMPYMVYREVVGKLFEQPKTENNEQQVSIAKVP